MKKLFSTLFAMMAIMLVSMSTLGATITQYNQTWSDTDNGAANPWTTLGTSNKFYSIDNGKQLLILNTTTTASAYDLNVTVESGPYIQGALGDKLYQLDTNKTYVLGPFELSRFKQTNGSIMVSLNASRATGFVVGVP